MWLLLYTLFFIIGQYASTVAVSLEWLLGQGWWIPLHIITAIPLVDVSRAFAQHSAEQMGISFKNTFLSIMLFSFSLSLMFSFKAGLPINICLAAFLSVNVGGVVGIVMFDLLQKVGATLFHRIIFSNLFATMIGGATFFTIAYTKFLDYVFLVVGYSFKNNNLMPNLIEGWIMQTFFIWVVGSVITYFINLYNHKVTAQNS